MRVLVYWHDMFLEHSAYLVQAFDEADWIDQIVLLGPEAIAGSESIFHQTDSAQHTYQPKRAIVAKVKTYRYMPKCCRFSEYKYYLKRYQPDLIIVLDEPLSMNVLLAGLARYQVQPLQGKVLFYGFENIYSTIPTQYLLDKPSIARLLSTVRKGIRFLLLDKLLMPIRKRLVYGGLTSYEECTTYIHKNNWYPKIKEQWWPINLRLFTTARPAKLADDSISAFKATNKNIIAYVGRFVREKGIEDLIQAIASLDESFVLLLIGSGPDQPLIQVWLERYQAQSKVLILGPQSPQSLSGYLHAIDLLVLPSRTSYFWKEQYGRILTEAMASQTLVIGSDSGSIPFVIGDPQLIFQENNPQALKEKIAAVFNENIHKNADLLEKNKKRALKAHPHCFIKAFCEL